jgi:hypothetical protein
MPRCVHDEVYMHDDMYVHDEGVCMTRWYA